MSVAVSNASADVKVGTTDTYFHESGGPLHMNVFTPSVHVDADLAAPVAIGAKWEADVVSGASVAVVDAPSQEVDAVSSATKLKDFRQVVGGHVDVRSNYSTLSAAYGYGFERDYRSHAFELRGKTDLFERNTTLEISYARAFDSVCSLAQPRAQEAVDKQRMPTSDGCFHSKDRASLDLSIQTFQAGWTQAWTPILTTQLIGTVQLLHGYQGNPYRAVWLGTVAAQENHPTNRARYALGLGTRLWIKPLHGALQTFLRGYRDTWDVRSITAEIGYEQTIAEGVRLRARERVYLQSGAAFFSDDYGRFPQGQYFTGDRELSAMRSFTTGGQLQWSVPTNDNGQVLGFLDSLTLSAKGDWLHFVFTEFHYGTAKVPNNNALAITASVEGVF